MQITVCGGGNLGHVLAGQLSCRAEFRVHVLLSRPDDVPRWHDRVGNVRGISVSGPTHKVYGKPDLVTSDPRQAIPGSGIIVVVLPAFLHREMLRRVAPFVDSAALVGAIPAQGGFQWHAARAFAECNEKPTVGRFGEDGRRLFGFRKSPWTCRIETYGRRVKILAGRTDLGVSTLPETLSAALAVDLSELFRLPLTPLPAFLDITLSAANQILHPGILYGLLADWDGAPFAEPPLAYEDTSAATAAVLQALSDELQSIRAALQRNLPDLDLSVVRPLDEEIRRACPGQIADERTLRSVIASNRSLFGLRIPTRKVAGGFLPDYTARYFTEDIPFGLCVLRGIAELAEVSTPRMDEVLIWAQDRMEKDYLRAGSLSGSDVSASGAPQAHGIDSLDQLLGAGPC